MTKSHSLNHCTCHFEVGCPMCITARGRDDPHRRRDEAEPNDPQVQLDFLFLIGNKHGDTQLVIFVLVLVDRASAPVSCTVTNKDALERVSHLCARASAGGDRLM